MTQTISVPDISFSGFYYPEILRELLLYFRRNRSILGLTDENEYEVHVQLLRAFALVGHLNNCRTDTIASELIYESIKLLESVKRVLKFVGITLSGASPAAADVLLKLSEVTSGNQTGFIPELAEWTTDSYPPISYEILTEDGLDLDRTDQVSYVYGLHVEKKSDDASPGGSVTPTAPDIFTRSGSDDTFASGDANKYLFIPRGAGNNGGEYLITEYLDQDNVRIAKVPSDAESGFTAEAGLKWFIMDYGTNHAVAANTNGSYFSPWSVAPVVNDMIYIGHKHILAGQINLTFETVAADITDLVLEYYDETHSRFYPTDVTDNGDGTITFDITSLSGAINCAGMNVWVKHLTTGVKERLESVYSGSKNKITTTGILGQVSVSETEEDYHIYSDWVPCENQTDNTSGLSQAGSVTFNIPQDAYRNWVKSEAKSNEAYFLRLRVVTVGTPTAPSVDRVRIDQGDQYMVATATQGETIGPQVIGSGDGSINQTFTLPETPFIDESETIEVDEGGAGTWVQWDRVTSFLSSIETSRHYMIETDAEDQATIKVGDGTNGKTVPLGTDNVRATYRTGGDIDGNVGIDEITTNADGVSGIASVTNPRPATGWRMKDGGTEEDIERLKRDKPAELRIRDTATNPGDIAYLAVNKFTDSNGTKPVIRATVFEEAYGIKTAKLLVVGEGGAILSDSQLSELEEYFNGDRYARPPVYGKLVLNQKVTAVNYEPQLITINAVVTWDGGNIERVRNALLALIDPLALESDNLTYVWNYEASVSLSRIYSEIHAVDPGIEDVSALTLNGSASSVKLVGSRLPYTTAANIVVTLTESS